MKKFRIHILSLAHTKCNSDFVKCAYTNKAFQMCKMMKNLGHEIYLYAPFNNLTDPELPPHDKFIPTVSENTWNSYLGDYDTNANFFKFNQKDPVWTEYLNTLQNELPLNIDETKQNFVLCWFGNFYADVLNSLPKSVFVVEAGIGYSGIFAKFKVFESYAWMHWIYGLQNKELGDWYDTVIPNAYDPEDFPFREKKENYFLFVGRLTRNKGINIAEQVSRHLGIPLYIAGQAPGQLHSLGIFLDDQVKYIGVLNKEERAKWMGGAQAVFVPTFYIGPFEGVNVEAQFCGTPVITSYFGVFNETVQHGVTGYRCRTFGDFIWAAKHSKELDPKKIREWAVSNFSLDRVKLMYQAYFEQLVNLKNRGWYETNLEYLNLDHFNKYYV